MSVSVLFHGADDGDDGPFHLASSAGWKLLGGTPLFRLYDTPDALAAQDQLARHRRCKPFTEAR